MKSMVKIFILLVVGLFLFACGFLQGIAEIPATSTPKSPTVTLSQTPIPTDTPTQTPSLTPTQTLTPTPSPTPTPTPIPAVIAVWENLKVDEVCLEVVQEYPQFDKNVDLPVYQTVAQILNTMGIDVNQNEDSCQAMLSIGFEGTVFSDTYSGSGEKMECFTGARVTGYLRMSKEGYAPIDLPMKASYSPQAVFGGCSKTLSPDVNWALAWIPEVVNRLADIWGASVATAALKTDQIVVKSAGVSLVKRFGPQASETVPLLISILSEYASIDAAEALERIGPAAMPAVPILIERLGEELKSTSPANFAWVYDNALEAITGQKPNDPSFWRGWWEMTNNQDFETLVKILTSDPNAANRRLAVETLGLKFSGEEIVIQVFIDALEDEALIVRIAAMQAIQSIGPAAHQAAPVLVERGHGLKFASDEWKFINAALVAIGVEAIPPMVNYALNDSNSWVKFLGPLREITGDDYDHSLDGEAWDRSVAEFLERCMAYYNQQTGK